MADPVGELIALKGALVKGSTERQGFCGALPLEFSELTLGLLQVAWIDRAL